MSRIVELLKACSETPLSTELMSRKIKNYSRIQSGTYLHKLWVMGYVSKTKIQSKYYKTVRTTDFYYITKKGAEYLKDKAL